MAIYRIYQGITNAVYQMRFVLDDASLSEDDKRLMTKYGEPSINVGGTFLPDTANEFVLPDKYIKVKAGFPYLQEFDTKAGEFSTATDTKVAGYRVAILDNIDDAYTTLRAENDTFTGEQLHTI